MLSPSFYSQEKEIVNWCGTAQKMNQRKSDPNFSQGFLDDELIRETEALKSMNEAKGLVYKVPVVFHILHSNGSENVEVSQIMNALEVINRDFRLQNEDTIEIVNEFKSIAADVEIDFVLATKAPNGNCFRGYTRTESFLTNQGDDGFAQVEAVRDGNDVYQGNWPSNKYLNIYVIGDAGGAGGYTYYPSNNNFGDMANGIWILDVQFGEIGTSSLAGGRSLTHEIGHWLNLAHTWGSSNTPNEDENCSLDDGVTDTPLCKGAAGCPLTQNSCGPLANVQNYMDYALSCQSMFTLGQAERMRTALTSSIGGRNNLWTTQNLIDTGTDTDPYMCKTEFSASSVSICQGSTIQFFDESFNVPSGWTWNFTGGSPTTSTAQNPFVAYPTPGLYEVSLTSTDGVNSGTEVKSSYIRVLANSEPLPYHKDFEQYNTLNNINDFGIKNIDEDHSFILDQSIGLSGVQSAKIENFGKPKNTTDELISSSIDLSSLDTSDVLTFSFRYAYKRIDYSDDDWLRLFVSNDCGESWEVRLIRHGFQWGIDLDTSPFVPVDEDWITVHVTNIFNEFFVNNFRYKFAFTSGGGNNFYLDDVNIYGGTPSDDVVVGINEIQDEISAFSLYPNPADEELNVRFDSNISNRATIKIADVTGKSIQNVIVNASSGTNIVSINTKSLTAGIYLMRIEMNGSMRTKKFIID